MNADRQLELLFLYTEDPERLARFYADLVGFPRVEAPDPHSVWLRAGGLTLVLHPFEEPYCPGPVDPAHAGTLPWFHLRGPTYDQTVERLRSAGVEPFVEFKAPPRDLVCVTDPEGRSIGLFREER